MNQILAKFLYMLQIHTKQNINIQSTKKKAKFKVLNDSKAFIEYSNDINDIYKNIEEYNRNKKQKILVLFDDMVADMLRNEKFNPMVTELFIRGRK